MALENKLGLTSSADLAREEERISKKKAVELFENGVLDTLPAGKFSTLQAIHKYLFDDIYDFAGKLRTVNLAKGNFRFAQPEEVTAETELKRMLKDAMQLLTEKEQKVILLYYYEDLTLKEISRVLEVSESRISQLHTKALQKMKKKMGPYMNILTD